MYIESLALAFAKDQGLKTLGDMLNLRPTEQSNIELQRSLIMLPDYHGLLFCFEMRVNMREVVPHALLFVRVVQHEEDAFSIHSIKLRGSAENLVFEYVPRTATWNLYDQYFLEPLRYAAMGKSDGQVVVDILEEVVTKLPFFELQLDTYLYKAIRSSDLSDYQRVLEERAEFLSLLPQRLSRYISKMNSVIQLRVVPTINLVAETAKAALISAQTMRSLKLGTLAMYYTSSTDQAGDKNEFEKILEFVKGQLIES